ncbi:thiamine pyrophosphate-dependent dehydrogenase E1 component subunit alpha [Alcaligenaceae bacterium]|nr:thiamine pyrophosphate-dependent dehydrogenase E1 component subunit alpha [Alcaligenaceae bacterium]
MNILLAERLYRTMCEIREFELAAAHYYKEGELPGFIHLSLGQEACAAGSCAALDPDDYIASNHRGHGHCLAKGASPRLMMAELFARAEGYGKGRGGSMHIADISKGVLGANGIVGQSAGLALGAALSIQVRKQQACAVAFFGEGASSTGIVHEAMNMAAIWRLPLVFFCESNNYAELSPYAAHVSVDSISSRAAGYGFPGVEVDGEDVFAVHDAMQKAVARARDGAGPTLIEAKASRWRGHYEGDPQTYKSPQEREDPGRFDPLVRFGRDAAASSTVPAERRKEIAIEAKSLIDDAVAWARSLPSPSLNAIFQDVYQD